MVSHSMTETYENDSHFDLTYILCVWITFLPTVTLPWFYAHWVLIGSLSRLLLVELFISAILASTKFHPVMMAREPCEREELELKNAHSCAGLGTFAA